MAQLLRNRLLVCYKSYYIYVDDQMPHFMDATDAVAAAYCHFLQMSRPETDAKHYGSWKDFARKMRTE